MRRLVLLGSGHGELSALPILMRRILQEKDRDHLLFVDNEIIRAGDAVGLVKWDKAKSQADYSKWIRYVSVAARRKNLGGVLAVFDGDAKRFPAGSQSPFCAATAAKSMAAAAAEAAGAGRVFSLAVVFACVEYETRIIAGAKSLAGKRLKDGRPALPASVKFPAGEPEAHGKKWLEDNFPGYRPARDQGTLTELLDLGVVRAKKLRSFTRLERAIDQLLEAVRRDCFVSTPC